MSDVEMPGGPDAERSLGDSRAEVVDLIGANRKDLQAKAGILSALGGFFRRLWTREPESAVAMSTILSSIGEGFAVYDREFRFQTWNPFMERLTGLSASQVLGKPLPEVFPELVDRGVMSLMSRALQGESVKPPDARFRIPFSGKEGWVAARYDPFRNAAGEIIGVVAIVRDISERKETERALAASERLMAIGSRIADVFLTVADEEMYGTVLGIVLEELDSRHGVFGYIDTEGSLVCPSLTSEVFDQCQMSDKTTVFPPDAWAGIWGRALNFRESIISNVPGVVPDGHIGIERCVFVPILDREEVIGLLAVGNRDTDYNEEDRDLLESIAGRIGPILHARLLRAREERDRLRAEQAVRSSEQRYRAVVELQTELVERFKEDGTVTFANDAMCRFFAVSRRDLIGTRFHPLMTDEDREATQLQLASLNPRNPIGVNEIPCVAPDGSKRWLSWTNQAMFDDDGSILEYQAVGRDITEQVKVADDLRRALAEKDTLLKEVHHRVKNNMAVISSMVSLQSDDPTHRDTKDALTRVRGRIRAMALVHEQIYRSGDFRRVDLADYSQSLINTLHQGHSSHVGQVGAVTRIEDLALSLDLAIPCGLILNELIGNSFEHAFPGDRQGEIVVELKRTADGRAELRVTDDGVGSPDGADGARDGGFGLQLVGLLAKQLGGTFEMVFENGAQATVTFPLDS